MEMMEMTSGRKKEAERRAEPNCRSRLLTWNESREVPSGRLVTLLALAILGLCSYLPWNFFMTNESYWRYKFRNTSATDWKNSTEATELEVLFFPIMVCLQRGVGFTFLALTTLLSNLVPQKIRIFSSLGIMTSAFLVTTALADVNTDDWQYTFFVVTLVIIFFMQAAESALYAGLGGIAGMFPELFMCALNSGQSSSGVFSAVARVASLALSADEVASSFLFFCIGSAVMLLCLGIYGYAIRVPFYKHYTSLQSIDEAEEAPLKSIDSFKAFLRLHFDILKDIWALCLCAMAVYVVTLAVYPVICVRVISSSGNLTWKDLYFQPVATFLVFNVGDFAGRVLAGVCMWPPKKSRLIYVFTAARLVFIPLFLTCKHEVPASIPSIFYNDFWYIFFMTIFSVSSGYLETLCNMYAPKLVDADKSEKAAMMVTTFADLGLFFGAILSFLLALIE